MSQVIGTLYGKPIIVRNSVIQGESFENYILRLCEVGHKLAGPYVPMHIVKGPGDGEIWETPSAVFVNSTTLWALRERGMIGMQVQRDPSLLTGWGNSP